MNRSRLPVTGPPRPATGFPPSPRASVALGANPGYLVLHQEGSRKGTHQHPGALMRCPRCSLAQMSDATGTCPVCGYSATGDGVRTPPDDAALELEARRELLHLFRIETLLKERPWSITYRARDHEHDRPVVVTVVLRRRLQGARLEDDFHRAAAAAAALDHPHVIPTYQSGATASFLWYSMKSVEGRPLDDVLRSEGRLEVSSCLHLVDQVASALHHAHQRAAVHGGLTPGNVIVDAQGEALVGDFVVSRLLDGSARQPEYTAPESLNGAPPAPSADQYALAAIAYECLSGTTPFAGASIEELVRHQITEPLPNLSEVRPDIPKHVPESLGRALRPDPTQRFPTVLDFLAALGGTPSLRVPLFAPLPRHGPGAPVIFMDDEPERRPTRRILAVVAGGVIALGVGAAWLAEGRPEPAILVRRGPAAAPVARADSVRSSPPPRTDVAPAAPAPTPAPLLAPVRRAPTQQAPAPSGPVPSVPVERAPISRSAEPAVLLVNATPSGSVYIDGQLVGTTPLGGVVVSPGLHRLRVEREGFLSYELTVDLPAGRTTRLTDITLQAVPQ